MHLPAWKPDLIILNSGGSGNYKQRAGDSAALAGREGGWAVVVEVKRGGEEGREVLGCPTVWMCGVRIQFAHLLLS